MAAKDTDDRKPDDQEPEISLDMSQAQVKKMIAEAREGLHHLRSAQSGPAAGSGQFGADRGCYVHALRDGHQHHRG